MKTILIIILLPFSAKAQIEKVNVDKFVTIGKAKSGTAFIASLAYYPATDTVNYLSYSDLTYRVIDETKTIEFTGGMSAVNDLYSQMNTVLQSKGETTLKIGKQLAVITGQKNLGVKSLKINIVDQYGIGSWFQLSEKQFNKLFNK